MDHLCVKHLDLWVTGRVIDQGELGATVRISRHEVVQVLWSDTASCEPNAQREDSDRGHARDNLDRS